MTTIQVLPSFHVLAVRISVRDVATISVNYHLQTLAEASRLYLRIELLQFLDEFRALLFEFINGLRWILLHPALGLREDGIIRRVEVW